MSHPHIVSLGKSLFDNHIFKGGGGKLEKMAVESGHLEGGRARAGDGTKYLDDQPPTKTYGFTNKSLV